MGHPLISVIMPAYNAEKTLPEAVESVLAQTYAELELIIINDCSKDATEEVAKGYAQRDARVKVLNNEKNKGASVTRHVGIEAARGDWLAFLDSDDAWVADKLQKQMELHREKKARFIFTASAFMDVSGKRLDWIMHVPEQIEYRKLLKQNLISNSSVLILKECYQRFEIMGDNMHEDFACWLNILRSGEIAYGIDEPLLVYRLSPNSKSGNKVKAARMNWNTYRRIGLGWVAAGYYMVWYVVNGMMKYQHFVW